jgi:hypothetical protein
MPVGHHKFSKLGSSPDELTFHIGGARSVSIHRPLRVPAVFKAAVAPGYFTLQSDGKLTRVSYDPEIGATRRSQTCFSALRGERIITNACAACWSPTEESNPVSSAYKAAASSAMLVGQIGARRWNRTIAKSLPKTCAATSTTPAWSREVELNHRKAPSESASRIPPAARNWTR